MRYKHLLITLAAFVLMSVQLAHAQWPQKIPRIGFLRGPEYPSVYLEAFRQGLRELGYVEGKLLPSNIEMLRAMRSVILS